MKKIASLIALWFVALSINAQDVRPVSSPEASAFLSTGFNSVNESSGKVDISIPLYTIEFDGLKIPIGIDYNSGGVQVNSSASSVGLNWSLNAGGFVSRDVKGYSDYKLTTRLHRDLNKIYYVELGSRVHTYPSILQEESTKDKQSDLYFAVGPGLREQFFPFKETIINPNTGESEITNSILSYRNQGTKVETSLFDAGASQHSYDRERFHYTLTSANGFQYVYIPREYAYNYVNDKGSHEEQPWNVNLTEEEIRRNPQDYKLLYYNSAARLFPVTHLSQIISPLSNKKVFFEYEDNYIVDNDRRIDWMRKYRNGNVTPVSTNNEHDFSKERKIKTIRFPDGIVNFYYQEGRQDVRGGKSLHKIEVLNNKGVLIKGILFKYSYRESCETSGYSYHRKRLQLDEVKFYNKNNEFLPGYRFTYNSTALPNRFSPNQDFLGYFNGISNVDNKDNFPIIYYKQGQGKQSYLPFFLTGYSRIAALGSVSKLPSLGNSKAGALERITYPTGGYVQYEFENHSFRIQNQNIIAGGLRIRSQSLYSQGGSLQKKVQYDYIKTDGNSSGTLSFIPSYVSGIKKRYYSGVGITQSINNFSEYSSQPTIVYSRVKVTTQNISNENYTQNLGYVVNEYTNYEEFPNVYPSSVLEHVGPAYFDSSASDRFDDAVRDGLFPSIFQNNSEKVGKLKTASYYDYQDNLVKRISNTYDTKITKTAPLNEHVIYVQGRKTYKLNTDVYARFQIDQHSTITNLISTEETLFSNSGNVISNTLFSYDEVRPHLLRSKESLGSDGVKVKEEYEYPFDFSNSITDQLINLNLQQPIVTTSSKVENNVSTILGKNESVFSLQGERLVLPTEQKTKIRNRSFETDLIVDEYDIHGNIIQYRKKDLVPITDVWGYNHQRKIAEVINATKTQVLSAMGITSYDELQYLSENDLKLKLGQLRNNLPNSYVTTYLFNELVGVKEKTTHDGDKVSYSYDRFKRLSEVKDKDGNIVKRIRYSYKNSAVSEIVGADLVDISFQTDYTYKGYPNANTVVNKVKLDAIVTGGIGDYNYRWFLKGSNTVLSISNIYETEVNCNEEKTFVFQITDAQGNSKTKEVSVYGNRCGEPFYLSDIYFIDTPQNHRVYTADVHGGSGRFSFRWNHDLQMLNYYKMSRFQRSVILPGPDKTYTLEVTDMVSGLKITRSHTNPPEENPGNPGEGDGPTPGCFIAGTKIPMADGAYKNIEDVRLGDKVLSYNLKTRETEVSEVEQIETPFHKNLVKLFFEKGLNNTNTLDHPYYVKGKGWASYDPKATKQKYGLNVAKMKLGDVVLFYQKGKEIKEIKLLKEEFINEVRQTYNLSKVSKNHNFFANGILVHNRSSF